MTDTSEKAIAEIYAGLMRFAGKVRISTSVEIAAATLIKALVKERDAIGSKVRDHMQAICDQQLARAEAAEVRVKARDGDNKARAGIISGLERRVRELEEAAKGHLIVVDQATKVLAENDALKARLKVLEEALHGMIGNLEPCPDDPDRCLMLSSGFARMDEIISAARAALEPKP